MNRRWLMTGLAGGFAALFMPRKLAVAASLQAQSRKWHQICSRKELSSFADLKDWIDSLPCQQKDGSPYAVCEETGQPYTTYNLGGLARPGDEVVIEAGVAEAMRNHIAEAIESRYMERLQDVIIYWRWRLEFEVTDYCKFDGKTKSFVPVENWRKIQAYCRFTVTDVAATALPLENQ